MQRLHIPLQQRSCMNRKQFCVRPRQHVLSRALCPYETLGIPATANDADVKKAFRKLALQYHPDVCQSEDAHSTFIAIQQAYDILSGKARGKDISTTQADWEWHDWYWNFCRSRNWRRNAAGKPQAAEARTQPNNSKSNENLRTQLAGLRHRAAIRAQKLSRQRTGSEPSPESSISAEEQLHNASPLAHDKEPHTSPLSHDREPPTCAGEGTEFSQIENVADSSVREGTDFSPSSSACRRVEGSHVAEVKGNGEPSSSCHVENRSVGDVSDGDSSAFSEEGPSHRRTRAVPGLDGNSRIMHQLAGLKRKAAYAREM